MVDPEQVGEVVSMTVRTPTETVDGIISLLDEKGYVLANAYVSMEKPGHTILEFDIK